MKKSIKDLSLDITEAQYRQRSALSYSTLSRFSREGWRKLSSLFDRIDSPSLSFGSAVDTKLTEPENFDNIYVVCEFPPISDTLISITKSLHNLYKDRFSTISEIPDEVISDIALSHDYYVNDKYAKHRVKSVKESCEEYYTLLTLSAGKTILSQSDYNDVMSCYNELKTNYVTKSFFDVDPWSNEIEKVFQLKFEAEYNGIAVRCMFDEIIVNHKTKTIYPIDLKTTGFPEEEFDGSFLKWRYDIQAKLYTYILQEVINKDEYFKDFRITGYTFIVINRRTLSPLVWIFDLNKCEKDLIADDGTVYKDWRSILTELKYYLDNPGIKYTKEATLSNRILKLNNLKSV